MAPDFNQALRFWHRFGWISFGGPAAQIAILHIELIERRRWIDEGVFLRGLNYCMVLPGPEAMQLATYLGWRLHGLRGGFAAGLLFVLPATLILAALGLAYLRWGELPAVRGALFGVQAVMLGVLAQALLRIGQRVLRTRFTLVLGLAALLSLVGFGLPFPLIVLGAAVAGVIAARWAPHWLPAVAQAHAHPGHETKGVDAPNRHAPPRVASAAALALTLLVLWWAPILALGAWLGSASTVFEQGWFFSRAALLTFGGAYAVLPYVAQHAVEVQQWLSAEQMLVGLGLAESTPGPLIMVLEFVALLGGWQQPDLPSPLLSSLLCAAIALWATFLPSFLFVLPFAPWIESLRERPRVSAALAGITAAIVGVIANLALWFAWHLLAPRAWSSVAFALTLALVAAWGLTRWRWNVAGVVAIGAAAGVFAHRIALF